MVRKVVLVGHCGADTSYLRIAVSGAATDISVLSVDDESELKKEITGGASLLLINRQLDYGFSTYEGIELISKLRADHPNLKTMLISNYPEAQAAAIAAGALPGFGKRQIGTPQVKEMIRAALGEPVSGAK
ncbi:MAG TPA: hypothetical protein VHD56_14025 [Tepidisphaeraceae bacterium]|nr:hypothetical protein [Tepidisphaeraceae bacterium]